MASAVARAPPAPISDHCAGRLGGVKASQFKSAPPLPKIKIESVLGVLSVLTNGTEGLLGRLGRVNQTHARYVVDKSNNNNESERGVLSVL